MSMQTVHEQAISDCYLAQRLPELPELPDPGHDAAETECYRLAAGRYDRATIESGVNRGRRAYRRLTAPEKTHA